MKWPDAVADRFYRWRYAAFDRYLSKVDPHELRTESEKRALKAFHRAASSVPAYGRILRDHGVDPTQVRTIEDFRQHVPLVDKEIVFASNELRDCCVNGTLEDVRLFFSSSGHSGVFSFGVETPGNQRRIGHAVDFMLDNRFRALSRKTLVINCLSMGVKVHSRKLALAETSVRDDVIRGLIGKLQDDFEQFILIGEHPFLKRVIEEGAEQGIPWEDLVVHVVTGGEYVAENFRSYLASRLGVDFDHPERGLLGVSFGISELALSLFSECPETIRIRRRAHGDAEFRRALYGRETRFCPNVMQYNPLLAYIETVPGEDGRQEMVVTTLDPTSKIPLIRYNTRDALQLMSYGRLREVLTESGAESFLPPHHLPLGMPTGKLKPFLTSTGQCIYSEQVKEALYAEHDIAAALTGNFRLREDSKGPELLVQLRSLAEPQKHWIQILTKHMKEYLDAGLPQISLVPYREFPYHLEHDFERKMQYV